MSYVYIVILRQTSRRFLRVDIIMIVHFLKSRDGELLVSIAGRIP